MNKKWIICTQCRYASECEIGQARSNNFEAVVSSDTGCYNYEQYHIFSVTQLKLFKTNREPLRA